MSVEVRTVPADLPEVDVLLGRVPGRARGDVPERAGHLRTEAHPRGRVHAAERCLRTGGRRRRRDRVRGLRRIADGVDAAGAVDVRFEVKHVFVTPAGRGKGSRRP
ncbi:hypothetical protein Q9Q99_19345 [Curtobacterium flaccumfaciens]|nr:hypothetical protein Q9Q99_19345 [Curtobacterium flaccumfaciens]